MEFKLPKKENFHEWYEEVTRKAEIVDDRYPVKGMPVYPWYGYSLVMNILGELEKMLEKEEFKKVWFPVLIPVEFFRKESEHFKGFEEEVFWIKDEDLIMRPTSETEMYYMFSYWVRSWRDLPIKIHQTCTVYRCETKQTKALIRGREIIWNEAHTCHRTKEEAIEMVNKSVEIYSKLFWDVCCIPHIWVKRPEWDKFPGAEWTLATETIMPDGKFLQIGTTHFLGQKFSKVFEIKFQDKDLEWKYVWQTCFGASMRVAGAIIGIHGDDRGLVLPPKIAPIQIVIVPIVYKEKKEEVLKKAKEVYEKLKEKYRVFLDDREEKTPGWKFYEWELKGVPLRIEIGPKDLERGSVTFFRRDTLEKFFVKDNEIEKKIVEIFELIEENLRRRAKRFFESKFSRCRTIEELEQAIKEGKVAKVPFCSVDWDGEECANILKEKLHVEIRGADYPNPETAEGEKCIVCRKPARFWVYVGRSY